MRLVIDATVAVEIALAGGDLGPLAGHELVAPPLLWSEATSVIRELAFRGDIPAARAPESVATLLRLPVTVETDTAVFPRAYELAARLGWAKTYDAEYVATATTLSGVLVTLDGRLARGVAGLVPVLAPADVPPL